jgi:hypothetical protein
MRSANPHSIPLRRKNGVGALNGRVAYTMNIRDLHQPEAPVWKSGLRVGIVVESRWVTAVDSLPRSFRPPEIGRYRVQPNRSAFYLQTAWG